MNEYLNEMIVRHWLKEKGVCRGEFLDQYCYILGFYNTICNMKIPKNTQSSSAELIWMQLCQDVVCIVGCKN